MDMCLLPAHGPHGGEKSICLHNPGPTWWGEMKDLNSPFKMEHFGYKHIGWNQFSDPFTKVPKIFRVPFGAQIGCSLLPQIGVDLGVLECWRGGGGCPTSIPPPPLLTIVWEPKTVVCMYDRKSRVILDLTTSHNCQHGHLFPGACNASGLKWR